MGGSSGGGTTRTEPPSYLEPYLEDSAQQSQWLYGTGGPQQYPGPTVTPFSQQTEQAMAGIQNRALSGSPVNAMGNNYFTNTLGGGWLGYNPTMDNPLASMSTQSIGQNLGGQYLGYNATMDNPLGQASAQSIGGTLAGNWLGHNPYASQPIGGATTGYVGDVLAGNYLNKNPYLDATYDRAAQRSRTALDSQFAGAGRDLQAQMPARSEQLNNLATSIYGNAYQQERAMQNQMAPVGANLTQLYGSAYGDERNRMMQALPYANQLAGSYGQAFDAERNRQLTSVSQANQLAGSYGDAFQNERQRQNALLPFGPTLANQDYFDMGQLANVGGQVEGLSRQYQGDAMNRWMYEQMLPENQLDTYIQRLGLNPASGYGTQYMDTDKNSLLGAAGGAAGGAMLASALGASNPWIWGAAGLGGLLGLL